MSAYTRDLRDAMFHVANARRSLERAQAKAPEADREAFDLAHRASGRLIVWMAGAARSAEARGGLVRAGERQR